MICVHLSVSLGCASRIASTSTDCDEAAQQLETELCINAHPNCLALHRLVCSELGPHLVFVVLKRGLSQSG